MSKLIPLTRFALGLSAYIMACSASYADTPAVMDNTPPTKSGQVTFKNYHEAPFNAWAFHNINAAFNTLTIPRAGQITPLADTPMPVLAKIATQDADGKASDVERVLLTNHTDSIVVLQNNNVLLERYYGDMRRADHHIWFSMTKSLVSTALGILVEAGKIDLQASPADYIPELKGSGYERTTIQNVLNHSSAIDFKENYTDLDSDFSQYYAPALNMGYIPGGRDAQPETADIYGVHDFLGRFIHDDKNLSPGQAFDYNSANADVAGWLVARVSGMPLHDFIEQRIWSQLGTEHDALIAVDRAYMPVATGGMISTTRDAALFGQMILNRGKVGKQQIVPASWIDQSLNISDTDRQKMKANSKYQDNAWVAYKNMWWILDADKGEYAAVGIHGQVIYINRQANVVAAYFSSQAVASAARNPQFEAKLRAVRAVAAHLTHSNQPDN